MSNDETYNGYANRETWAFNLHWQNDRGLYLETLHYAVGLLTNEDESKREVTDREIGESVVAFWRGYIDTLNDEFGSAPDDTIRMFDREVGSWWRIDYAEVGEAVRESLDAES